MAALHETRGGTLYLSWMCSFDLIAGGNATIQGIYWLPLVVYVQCKAVCWRAVVTEATAAQGLKRRKPGGC
jgi:hypothetical protein